VSQTRLLKTIVLYAVCMVGGTLAGLFASYMIVIAPAGPKCCAPGDGILFILYAAVLVPLGAMLAILLAATFLRVRRRAENNL
jgi:hypothetical protein